MSEQNYPYAEKQNQKIYTSGQFRYPYIKKPRVQTETPGKSRTKQSFKNECDINTIMAKYQKTGAIAHVNKHATEYGFATSADFSTAMRTVTVAQEMFDGLPSSIRNRFNNNPGQFLDFVQDANNKVEGQELGLWPKDPKSTSTEDETPPEGTILVEETEPTP